MADSALDEVVVKNNALSAPQIDDFAARAKGCEARGDCKQIVQEMEALSLKQQQEMIAVCSTNPAACKEKYGDIPANGMLVREAIDRVLGDDVPSKMKNDMSSLLAQQIEAEGVVSSTDFAQRLHAIYGIDPEKATLLAGAALSAATGGMSKGGKPAATNTGSKIINPATNKVVTEHTVVSFGKALRTSAPNSVYEVSRADGTKSITYYDDKGRMFSREDYGQQRTHGSLGYDSNGKIPPHEHKATYNDRGYLDKKYYREIDKDGKAVGPWIPEK